jgi:hypothetical protein
MASDRGEHIMHAHINLPVIWIENDVGNDDDDNDDDGNNNNNNM